MAASPTVSRQKSRSTHHKSRSSEKAKVERSSEKAKVERSSEKVRSLDKPKVERRRKPRSGKRSCCSSRQRCPHHALISFDDNCAGQLDFSGDDFQSTDFLGDSIFDDDLLDESREYTCMTETQLLEEQTKEVQSVAELLALSPATASALLRKFQWKKETLLGKYFENPEKVFRDAGVKREAVFRPSLLPIRIPSENQSQTASTDCSVCAE